MKFYIPEIGDKLKLTKPWTFDLYDEYRNDGLIDLMSLHPNETRRRYVRDRLRVWQVTLPAGTILKISRIYIRQGASEYSSIKFHLDKESAGFPKKGKMARFWAKLADVNQIEFNPEPRD